jgi:predicted transposase/invertase (TIGR01784 family)
MGRYLDPKNDIPFKRIFGEHPELLRSFLNALMPFEKGRHIVSLKYLPAELVPENPIKKDSIVDVRCTDNYGRQFIVEMQMYWSKSFANRMVFNASKSYIKQLNSGEDYDFLKIVYALAILNDVFDKDTSEYYHHYQSLNRKNTNDIIKGLEFILIELPKFIPVSMTEKRMSVLWLRFLREIKENEYIEPAPELMKNKYIRHAIELCEEGAYSDQDKFAYERYWDVIRKERSALSDSLAEGVRIGKAEGIEIGKSEGIEIGKSEEKENTVLKGFKNGVSLDIISYMTDLSNEEVVSILKKHKLIK